MPKIQIFDSEYNRYLPAVLRHEPSMGWIIEYYVYNPVTDKLDRKRMRLNALRRRYSKVSEFKVAANEILCTINAKLAGGWSPFGESENSRYYTPLDELMRLYIEEKEKELKPDTLRSYKSFCRIFGNWCSEVVPKCRCIQFNKSLAVKYMDYIYMQRKVSARAYNNQIKMGRALFSWAVSKCYCKENPFELIKVKKVAEKKRILIPIESRQMIRDYFAEECSNFVIVMELVFTSLLRPKEITRVQIKDIHLDEHYIYMPSEKTKNGYHRYAYLSDELCDIIAPLIKNASSDYYLFSADLYPGKNPILSTKFTKMWDKMRKTLKLPIEMQLYSLRDTGINNMLKAGIDPLSVMQAADHHDLSMTTRYANHVDPTLFEKLRKLSPSF